LTSVSYFRLLCDTGVPVPAVLVFDDTRQVIPYDFMIMEALPGQEAGRLPVQMQRRAGFLTGQALRRVHEVKPGGFGYPLPTGSWSSSSWLDALRRNYMEDGSTARKREVFSAGEDARIEALTLGNTSLEAPVPRLIHGDPSPANSLCTYAEDDVTLTGLIDPSVVIGGDPMFDLVAGTGNRDDFGRGLWDGYTHDRSLTIEGQNRFSHLLLFSCYWTACWQYATGREHLRSKEMALELLHALSQSSVPPQQPWP
jgi:aminoglycoside phosphotransferase (APT) family kinase protein